MFLSHAETAAADPMLGEIVLLLRKVLYAPDGSVTAETRLDELGLDSLDLLEAALEMEALLGRDIADAALRQARTVGDLARCFGEPDRRRDVLLAA